MTQAQRHGLDWRSHELEVIDAYALSNKMHGHIIVDLEFRDGCIVNVEKIIKHKTVRPPTLPLKIN